LYIQSKEISTNHNPDGIRPGDRDGGVYVSEDNPIKSDRASGGVISDAGVAVEEQKPAGHVHPGGLHSLKRAAQFLARSPLLHGRTG
jgi:hypothetical protein